MHEDRGVGLATVCPGGGVHRDAVGLESSHVVGECSGVEESVEVQERVKPAETKRIRTPGEKKEDTQRPGCHVCKLVGEVCLNFSNRQTSSCEMVRDVDGMDTEALPGALQELPSGVQRLQGVNAALLDVPFGGSASASRAGADVVGAFITRRPNLQNSSELHGKHRERLPGNTCTSILLQALGRWLHTLSWRSHFLRALR